MKKAGTARARSSRYSMKASQEYRSQIFAENTELVDPPTTNGSPNIGVWIFMS